MQNKTLWIGVGIFAAVILVGGYLLLSKDSPAPTTIVETSTQAPVQTSPQGSGLPSGEVKEVTVEGDEYSYKPSTLKFEKGDVVSLTFKNVGNLPHNLKIDELGVETETIPGGESDTVTFTVTEGGSFELYCSVGSHRSLGMEGEVQVE